MNIIPLFEGIFTIDKNKKFILKGANDSDLPYDVAVRPFVIVTGTDVILLDAGLGGSDGVLPTIYNNLKQVNITPEQVTKVLISHLHKDHIDGIGRFEKGHYVNNFPDASIYIQRREFDYALAQAGNPSYNFRVLDKLAVQGNLIWLDMDAGLIAPGITYQVTGGHSPYHQAFWISDEHKTAFYGGDNLPKASYLETSMNFKTDYDGKLAQQLREEWANAGKEKWEALLYHDLQQASILL